MSNAMLSCPDRPSSSSTVIALSVLAAWLAAVLWLGAAGAFVSPPGTPPLGLLAGVALPLIAFFALLRLARPFREFVLAVDLRLIAAVQAWRFGGFAFLALYVYGILPAVFAFPAGLGDMAVAAAAPWMVLNLSRDPRYVASVAFRRWNLLGILDLVVAVTLGALSFMLAGGSPHEVTTEPMARLPLVLVPAYLVPIFIMLHFSALQRTRVQS